MVEPPPPEPHADWLLAETAFHQRTGGDDTFRRQLDRDLKFGYENTAMNGDRRARLKSNNKSSYFGVLGELRAGSWLTSGGAVIDEWDPLGSGERRGEFVLRDGSIKIFTEVKSHFGDSSMQLTSRRADSLRQRLYERRKSLNSVDIVVDLSNSTGGTDQYLEGDLLNVIARCARNVTRGGTSEVHDLGFVDCSVRIEVREKTFDTGMTHVMNGGTAGPVESLMRTLKKAARPGDASPYLAAVYDFDYWLLDYSATGGISMHARERLSKWLSGGEQQGEQSSRVPDAVFLFGESFTATESGGGVREQAVLLARQNHAGKAISRIVKGLRPTDPLILSV